MAKYIEKVAHEVQLQQLRRRRFAVEARPAVRVHEPVAFHAARLHGHHLRHQIVRQHAFLREGNKTNRKYYVEIFTLVILTLIKNI